MMKKQVIYVLTHDSIGLGEDGPTHQPVEHLVALRSIPNLIVLRPCDAIETFESWEIAINTFDSPSAIILSRQNLPLLRKEKKSNKVKTGGYFLNYEKNSKLTIIATGSEVSLAQEVTKILKEKYNCLTNIVSMPSIELFEKQTDKYKNKILGTNPRVIIEAASSFSWFKYLNKSDLIISLDTFGESGNAKDLFNFFGFSCKSIVNLIKKKLL